MTDGNEPVVFVATPPQRRLVPQDLGQAPEAAVKAGASEAAAARQAAA